jgi:hypothetical protein
MNDGTFFVGTFKLNDSPSSPIIIDILYNNPVSNLEYTASNAMIRVNYNGCGKCSGANF